MPFTQNPSNISFQWEEINMPYHQEDKISNRTTTIDQLVPFSFDNMLHFDNRRIWPPGSTQFKLHRGSQTSYEKLDFHSFILEGSFFPALICSFGHQSLYNGCQQPGHRCIASKSIASVCCFFSYATNKKFITLPGVLLQWHHVSKTHLWAHELKDVAQWIP